MSQQPFAGNDPFGFGGQLPPTPGPGAPAPVVPAQDVHVPVTQPAPVVEQPVDQQLAQPETSPAPEASVPAPVEPATDVLGALNDIVAAIRDANVTLSQIAAACVEPAAGFTSLVQVPAALAAAAAAAGQLPQTAGTGAAALHAMANGQAAPTADGFSRVVNKHGKTVVFPATHQVSRQAFCDGVTGRIAAVDGVPASFLHVYDNREDAETGARQLPGASVGRVVLSKDAEALAPLAKLKGKALAWVSYADGGWKVQSTPELEQLTMYLDMAGQRLTTGGDQ